MLLNVSQRDLDTILAALRNWQNTLGTVGNPAELGYLFNIANDTEYPLDAPGIDQLCERINVITPQVYLIQHKFTPDLWWNNETGWGSCAGADLFDGDERREFQAPVEGVWMPLEDLPIEVDRKEREVQLWMSDEMR